MSEKLLQTVAGKSKSLKDLYAGTIISEAYLDPILNTVMKEDMQMSHEFTRPLNGAGFGSTASFNFQNSEMFVKNIALQIELNAGTVVLPPAWAYQLIDEIIIQYPGSQRRIFSGTQNFIQTLYEARSEKKRAELIELAGGAAAVTNPGANVVGYTHLNVMTSSVDERRKNFFPMHLLSQNVEIQIRFKRAVDFFPSGTTTISSVKVLFERANILDPKNLKHKNKPYVLQYYTVSDYQYGFIGNANGNAINIQGLTESGETQNILYTATLDSDIVTNKNSLNGLQLNKILVKLGDRDIVSSEDHKFNDLLHIWNCEEPLTYTLAGASQYFYNIPFSLLSYRDQLSMKKYAVGSMIEQDDLSIKFASAAASSQLRVFLYQKALYTFHNGLMSITK